MKDRMLKRLAKYVFFVPLIAFGAFCLIISLHLFYINMGWEGLVGLVLVGVWVVAGIITHQYKDWPDK